MFVSPLKGRTKRCAVLGVLLALHGLALRPAAAALAVHKSVGSLVVISASSGRSTASVLPDEAGARRDFHLKAHFVRRHHRRTASAAGTFGLAAMAPSPCELRLPTAARLPAGPPSGPDYPPSRV